MCSNVEMVSNGKKLKILALHGYRQNGDMFRKKTGSFRKIVNKWAEFTYITAPHKVISENADQDEANEQYGWFFNKEDKSFRGTRTGGPAIGFEESVKLVDETIEKEGPFDGIMGFSQGACFVALFCSQKQRNPFKFAIMIAGFKSGSVPHSDYYKEDIFIPNLHVFGDTDEIIPPKMSRELSDCFARPQILTHPGGHFVPASSAQKPIYQKFFEFHHAIKNMPDVRIEKNPYEDLAY